MERRCASSQPTVTWHPSWSRPTRCASRESSSVCCAAIAEPFLAIARISCAARLPCDTLRRFLVADSEGFGIFLWHPWRKPSHAGTATGRRLVRGGHGGEAPPGAAPAACWWRGRVRPGGKSRPILLKLSRPLHFFF